GAVIAIEPVNTSQVGDENDVISEITGAAVAGDPGDFEVFAQGRVVSSAKQHVRVPKVTTPGVFAGVQHGGGLIGHIGDPCALLDGLADSLRAHGQVSYEQSTSSVRAGRNDLKRRGVHVSRVCRGRTMTPYNTTGSPPGMGDWGVLTADVDYALAGIEGVDGDRDLLEIVR